MMSKKPKKTGLARAWDLFWNWPDYMWEFSEKHPKIGIPLSTAMFIGLIVIFLFLLNLAGTSLGDFGEIFSKARSNMGEATSGLLLPLLIFGAVITAIAIAAKRYNKKHGHDLSDE